MNKHVFVQDQNIEAIKQIWTSPQKRKVDQYLPKT